MNHSELNNFQDVIDSRDVIKAIEEIEDEITDLEKETEELGTERLGTEDEDKSMEIISQIKEKHESIDDLYAELEPLKNLAAQWYSGETLVRESYFRDYAMDLADEIGAIPEDAPWPLTCIDWDQAAEDLKTDYAEIDFDGVSYYVRA